MTDFWLGLVIGFVVALVLGYMITNYIATWLLHKIQLELQDKLDTELEEVVLRVERVGDVIYCYDDHNQFICQGRDVQEIEQSFRDRYPNGDCVLILRGEKDVLGEMK
jgi:hypothetical protein